MSEDGQGAHDSVWTRSIADFGSALADVAPMPAGVAAATVTASIGLALLLKVLAIVAKKQPIPGLAGVARRHLIDLQDVVEADAGAYQAYLAAPRGARQAEAFQAIRIPLGAARSAAAGVELCAQAHQQVTGPLEADLETAARLLHGAALSMLTCARANLRYMPLEEEARLGLLEDARHVTESAEAALGLVIGPIG